jgi:transketolase
MAYGPQGMTHHATEDLAIMRALPGMTVVAPGDTVEARLATRAILEQPGPCYLRLGKAGEATVHKLPPVFRIGRAIVVQDGSDVTLVSTGGILANVVQAAESLANDGIRARVLSMHTLKPLDRVAMLDAASATGAIVTVEEHSLIGGLGSAVAEVLAELGPRGTRFRSLAIPNYFASIGSQDHLRKEYGLTPEAISRSVHDVLASGKTQ